MTTLHFNRVGDWENLPPEPRLRAAVEEALRTRDPGLEGEISVTFVTEQEIHALNLQYLGVDGPTDVIAFEVGGPETLLGDIYIAPEVASRRAAEWSVPGPEELLRLVVHGVLHVLGHDHPSGDDRFDSDMFRLQEAVLRRLDS